MNQPDMEGKRVKRAGRRSGSISAGEKSKKKTNGAHGGTSRGSKELAKMSPRGATHISYARASVQGYPAPATELHCRPARISQRGNMGRSAVHIPSDGGRGGDMACYLLFSPRRAFGGDLRHRDGFLGRAGRPYTCRKPGIIRSALLDIAEEGTHAARDSRGEGPD